MSRRVKIFAAFVAIIVSGLIAAAFFGSSGGVPSDFTDARLQGALIAQNIVDLSNQAVHDLERISEFDRKGNFSAALDLTSRAVTQSRDIRERAVALAQEIEKMTRALSEIRSLEARQAALESITNRLTLISRLINYSASLGQLLDALQARFSGAPDGEKIAVLIEQINAEVRAINSFNRQATQAMERFDTLIER